jgi:hypothetical protein
MTIRTIFSSEDTDYLYWQVQLLAYSHQRVGQPGEITCLVAHDGDAPPRLVDGVDMYVTRQASPHPVSGDDYKPYNKPASLLQWLEETPDSDETLLVIDPDCVFLEPIDREVESGQPVGEQIFFMSNTAPACVEIIRRHCRRNESLVQPVGVPLLIQRSDLLSICPRWLELTAEMREDKFTREEIPWICEMWGYSIAAAEAGITHELGHRQQFPTEDITDRPLIHYSYATESHDKDWKWDKRDYSAWSKPPSAPDEIPAAGRIFHALLDQAAAHFRYESISRDAP